MRCGRRLNKHSCGRLIDPLPLDLMNVLEFTFLVWAGALVAGFLGSLTGLGGGVVLVPLLTIFFHVDLRYAIGASLVSVIATSYFRTLPLLRALIPPPLPLGAVLPVIVEPEIVSGPRL